MKLKQWAASNGVSYRTAWRWFHQGTLPVPPAELDRQLARLTQYAISEGWHITAAVSEVGSAMNGRRPKLRKLLADVSVKVIVVEHRDRLTRFGFEYLEAAFFASGRRLCVIDNAEAQDDLVRDMCEVLTSFCARLYGRRSAKRKATAALRIVGEA
jgi:putative resolvase